MAVFQAVPSTWYELNGAERREWMGMGVAGIIINSNYGSFPHSLLSTSKLEVRSVSGSIHIRPYPTLVPKLPGLPRPKLLKDVRNQLPGRPD